MMIFTHLLRVLTGDSNQNLRNTQEHAEKTERALRDLETRAGRVGSAAGRLAGGLGRISPGLAELAMLTNDAADGFEVMTMGGAKALRILGPVAAAAGVAAGAYLLLKQNLDQMIESQKEANEQATKAQQLFTEVGRAQDLAAVASGDMSVEEFNRNQAMDQGNRLFAERIQQLEAQLNAARQLRDAEVENFNRIATSSAQVASSIQDEDKRALFLATTTQRLKEQTVELEKAQTSFNKAETALQGLNRLQSEYIDNLQTVANANNSVAASNEDVAASTDKTADSVDRLAELLDNVDAALGPGRNEQLQAGLDDLQRRIELRQRLIGLRPEEAAAPQELIQGINFAAIEGGISQGLGALASPGAALGALGPAGAVIGGLAAIGQAGGAAGVEETLDELLDNVTDGIEALPDILVNVIPPFVQALVTELPPAIAAAMVGLIAEAFERVFPGQELNQERREFVRDVFALGVGAGAAGFIGAGIAGVNLINNRIDRRQASSRGRMARADGARRMAMSRAPTAQIMGSPNLTINALGIDDGTQDQFQRRFARYTDPNTGLRGRDG